MAYNNINKLKQILKVQDAYMKHHNSGATDKFIFENYIKDIFNISYKTFWTYLNTNAKQKLKDAGHYGNSYNDK